jgi:tetratricopeptide (TPR) repeat protein
MGMLLLVSQIDYSKINVFRKSFYFNSFFLLLALVLSVKVIARSKVYKSPALMAKAAISESPHAIYFYIVLGKICAVNKMPDEAIKWYDKYIEIRKNSPIPYANKASILYGIGKYDESISNFSKAISLEPQNGSFHKDRAFAYYKTHQYDSSLADILYAKRSDYAVNADFEKEVRQKIELYKEIDLYSRSIDGDTATSFSYCKRGLAYFYAKQYDRSINDFSSGIKLDTNDHICLINRGFTYESIGLLDSAYRDYKKLADRGSAIGQKALQNLQKKMQTKNF